MNAVPPTNLRVIRPNRTKPQPGQVFAMQLPDGTFLFGRIISTEAQWTFAEGADPAILIYIYSGRSDTASLPPRSAMTSAQLLVPPIMTNRLPWSRGCCQPLEAVPLETDEVLDPHCFLSTVRGKYFDDRGNELPGPVGPVGVYGLSS